MASPLPFDSQVMTSSAEKVRLAGNPNVMVCERGTMFGYSEALVFSLSVVSSQPLVLPGLSRDECYRQGLIYVP